MPAKDTHTKASSYRFTPRTLEIAKEIADDLRISLTTVFTLAVTALHRQLGYKARDAVAAVESITRVHGDDAPVVVTLTEPVGGDAKITINGQGAGEDWSAWAQTAGVGDDGEPIGSAAFYARWEPKRVTFALGEVGEAVTGSTITVRATDLVDLVVLRSEADERLTPAERRAALRAEFEFRRELDRMLAERGMDGIAGGDRPDDDD
jgi:hypothetical protein